MTVFSRRQTLRGGVATAAAPALVRAGRPDTIVIGAGVMGAWTAAKLQEAGQRVLLLDAYGPAHARASSGGESRLIRAAYGADLLYARMAWESLPEWQALSARAALPLFVQSGVLFFYPSAQDPAIAGAVEAHRQLGKTLRILTTGEITKQFPMIAADGIGAGVWEPEFGALMARRAVQTLVAEFIARGGGYRRAEVEPPDAASPGTVTLGNGSRIAAGSRVFACGPWLGKLFPALLAPRLFVTRQEVFFFRPPPGGTSFGTGSMPGWSDNAPGADFYGFPDIESRGVKIANDDHGPPADPDRGDRLPSPGALAEARAYLARRFPALRDAPLNEARVCQYENSATGDLLIDRHPDLSDTILVGMGSGHGFKHGPAIGRRAADLVLGRNEPEPRLRLAGKATAQARAVH